MQVALDGFNPRARMGRDDDLVEIFEKSAVSIHAPAWGATLAGIRRRCGDGVSIHAPAWGAT